MKTQKKIETIVDVYTCDICGWSTDNNRSYAGSGLPIEKCCLCQKDICQRHKIFFCNDWYAEYPHSVVCCPDCKDVVEKMWDDIENETHFEGAEMMWEMEKRIEDLKKQSE